MHSLNEQVALLCGHSEVHMGFEKSADFGNGVYVNDVEVNHQFDKSSAFLQAARAYITRFLSPTLRVISPLDAMWDLEVSLALVRYCIRSLTLTLLLLL
jgi:hypothetical protein